MQDSSRLRILDANRNRAAEGLRVAEDVCRFHWERPELAARLKAARHAVLASVEECGSVRDRLACRDAVGDVGRETRIEPATSPSLAVVFERNLERAREAVRVLEELSRGAWPKAARALEGVRYALYELEQAARVARGERRTRLASSRLCLLATRALARRDLVDTVRVAIEAGVDVVQLREKAAPDREVLGLGQALRELTRDAGALLIVNDRPDLALACDADGVHLGQGDLPAPVVRRLLGADRLVGVSTHSVEDARKAVVDGADYIGVGPMFPTRTKDAGPILGPEGLRRVLEVVDLPAFAIGGVAPDTAAALRAAGARAVAVSGAILGAEDVRAVVARLLETLRDGG